MPKNYRVRKGGICVKKIPDTSTYDSSVDFTSEWESLTGIIESFRLNHWLQETDTNFGTKTVPHLEKLVEAVKAIDDELYSDKTGI